MNIEGLPIGQLVRVEVHSAAKSITILQRFL